MKKLSLFIVMISFWGLNVAIGQWSYNGTNIYNSNNGYVGIGANSPSTLLHVAKNMTEPTITVQNLGGIGGATYTMTDNVSGANWKFKATNNGGFKIRDHANSLDVIVIEPNSAANSLYIRSGGSVGIGTPTPPTTDKFSVYQSQSTGTAIYANVSGTAATAIFAYSLATTGVNYGIRSNHESTEGAAAYFHANNNTGACAGVHGRADGDVYPASCGVVGHHYWGGVGVGAWSYSGDLIQGWDGDYPGGVLRFYVSNSGAVYADGGYNSFKKVMSPGEKEEYRTFNSIQATESWIEDIGSSELRKGEATVSIDPVFAQTVDLHDGYLVFLTPVNEEIVCLVVTSKSTKEFVVKGSTLDGRPVSCNFDYKIVAKDSQKRNARMQVVNIPEPIIVPRED